jgi:hypothetical protein
MMRFGSETKRLPAYAGFAVALIAAGVIQARAQEAVEVPKSYDEASKVDTPILRVPLMAKPPTIDGVMSPGEWDDASALSAFRYDIDNGIFTCLAPHQTQVKLYVGYDHEFLYFCKMSPVYPEGSWLKARGRFQDTLQHPLYGMLNDDHTELEIRPVEDLKLGQKLGLLRWDVNPIGTICDWLYSTAGGSDFKYTSRAEIRSVADDKAWVIEYKIPLTALRYAGYDGKDEIGRPLVQIPPADGTTYRFYCARGIGGNGAFFNNFDDSDWETMQSKFIFDSKSPVIQINDMGRIMDNQIDVQVTLKNHNTRSETVRLGFHVESAQDQIYSSYNSPETPNGIVQLRPGETKKLRLRHSNPKMTLDGNVLWFDVRSFGTPSKTLFCTRLIKTHLMDGGAAGSPKKSFRERRLDVIKSLRPERIPFFDFRVEVSPYTKRLMAVLDRGIVGVKEEVKTAVEAQLVVRNIVDGDEKDVHEFKAPVIGNFATFDVIASNLVPGEVYSVTAYMFDENMKIVGEQTEKEPFIKLNHGGVAQTTGTRVDKFTVLPEIEATTKLNPRLMFTQNERPAATRKIDSFQVAPWMNNKVGLMDEVWEPFTPIRVTATGFETLKHRFTIDESGLPAQIAIVPDPRELPLELRTGGQATPDVLQTIGRGAQFRAPMRLEAVVGGKPVRAKVVTPAKAIRTGKSEIEYASTLEIGSMPAELKIRYDCDGSFRASLRYGGDTPVKIDRLELVTDVAGIVDLAVSDTGQGMGDVNSDRGECGLPNKPGVVWDSTMTRLELFYSRFVPSFWFGSADRGWSYYCDSDRGWILDRNGSSMQLERNKNGEVTWRVAFVNHSAEVTGRRTIDFAILTHPAKPKPENFRQHAWHYTVGKMFAFMQIHASANWSDNSELLTYMVDDDRLRGWWRDAAGAAMEIPDEQRTVWRNDMPPYYRYGISGGGAALNLPDMNRLFEEKGAFYLSRLIGYGRRTGWLVADYSPISQSMNLAMGDAYLRPLKQVGTNELPWHPGFTVFPMRDLYKRLARVQMVENVSPRQQAKANGAGRLLESFLWNTVMMKTVGVGPNAPSYDVDLILLYPNALYRTMAMNYAGVITTMAPQSCPVGPGDDPRFDRQKLGLALLHDFGVTRDASSIAYQGGPGGHIQDIDQGLRLLGRLARFGFFRDDDVEKLPFWRNDALVRLGDKPNEESKARVTVYRRPLDNGKGYQAIFVILNESDADIELPLNLLDSKRLLGGANSLRGGEVVALKQVPEVLKAAWSADAKAAVTPALRDFETDALILRAGDKAERYGPVFVPYHDYRILYAECRQ